MVEERAKISTCDFLCFGIFAIKYLERKDLVIEIGEFNQKDNLEGRGIRIEPNGEITVGWWINNWSAPGNYFRVYADGNFNVGKFYMDGTLKRYQGIRYKTDGST